MLRRRAQGGAASPLADLISGLFLLDEAEEPGATNALYLVAEDEPETAPENQIMLED